MVYYKQTVIVDGSLTHADVLPYPSQPSSLMRNGRLSSLQTLIAATLIPASFALAKQAIVNHVQFARLVDTSIPELLGCSFLGAVSSAYIAPATEESGVNLSLCPVCVGGEPMLLADKALSLGGLSCSTFGRTLAPPEEFQSIGNSLCCEITESITASNPGFLYGLEDSIVCLTTQLRSSRCVDAHRIGVRLSYLVFSYQRPLLSSSTLSNVLRRPMLRQNLYCQVMQTNVLAPIKRSSVVICLPQCDHG